jgi:hypothetical protein
MFSRMNRARSSWINWSLMDAQTYYLGKREPCVGVHFAARGSPETLLIDRLMVDQTRLQVVLEI